MLITLLTENSDSVPPTQADLNTWADQYGQTFPVVSDGDRYIHTFGAKGSDVGVALPSQTLLGPGGEILVPDGEFTEEDIAALFQ